VLLVGGVGPSVCRAGIAEQRSRRAVPYPITENRARRWMQLCHVPPVNARLTLHIQHSVAEPLLSETVAPARSPSHLGLGMRSMPKLIDNVVRASVAFFLLGLLAACGDRTLAPAIPAEVVGVAGDGQNGTVAQPLPEPVRIEVRDAGGRPVSGVSVVWGTSDVGGSVLPQSSQTARDGTAAAEWQLGTSAGPQTLTVSSGSASITIHATAFAGAAARLKLTVASTHAQHNQPGGTLVFDAVGDTAVVTAVVTDVHDNPLPPVQTDWESSDPAVVSISNGGVLRSLTSGHGRITARNRGQTAFLDITIAPGAASLTIAPRVLVLAAIPDTARLVALVRDRNGNTTTHQVTWRSERPSDIAVDSTGLVTALTPSPAVRVIASASTLADTITVRVEQQVNDAEIVGDNQVGRAGHALAGEVGVQLRDRLGSAIPGVLVRFVPATDGSTRDSLVATGPDGRATTTWTLGLANEHQQMVVRLSAEGDDNVVRATVGRGRISGSVAGHSSGPSIAARHVRLLAEGPRSYDANTDSAGTFEFVNVLAGTYRVRAIDTFADSVETSVEVYPDAPSAASLIGERARVPVTVTLRNAEGLPFALPLVGYAVQLAPAEGGDIIEVPLDATASASTTLPWGAYRFGIALPDGYALESAYQGSSLLWIEAAVPAVLAPRVYRTSMHARTVVLDSTQARVLSISDQHVLLLFHGTPQSFNQGDVLLYNSDGGLLRHVDEVVSSTGNMVELRTRPASIGDAFDELTFRAIVPLALDGQGGTRSIEGQMIRWGRPRLRLLHDNARVTGDVVTLSAANVIQKEYCGRSCDELQLLITGTVGTGLALDAAFDGSSLTGVSSLHATAIGEVLFQLDAELKAAVSDSMSDETRIVEYDIEFYHPGVWGTVTVTLYVGYDFAMNSSGRFAAGASARQTITAGVSYRKDRAPRWQTILEVPAPEYSAPSPELELQGSADLRVYARPEVRLALYKSVSGTIGPEPYLQAIAAADLVGWDFGLDAGLDVGVNFNVSVFGWLDIYDYSNRVAGPRKTLVARSSVWGAPILAQWTATPASPLPNQPFDFVLRGSGFDPTKAEVVFTGAACQWS
jgi:hypothetical protein